MTMKIKFEYRFIIIFSIKISNYNKNHIYYNRKT